MKNAMRACAAVLAITLCSVFIRSEVSANDISLGQVDGYTIDLAFEHAYAGIAHYYKVYGKWPNSYKDVVTVGLVQVPLRSPNGSIVDPDDRKYDFVNDFVYVGPEYTGAPASIFYSLEKAVPSGMPFRNVKSYAEFFKEIDGKHEEMNLTSLLGNTKRLRQFAIAGILDSNVSTFYHLTGRWPSSYDELIDSGVSPYDRNSINPMTGITIKCDGSPNDFLFHIRKDGHPLIKPVDGNGDTPWRFTF